MNKKSLLCLLAVIVMATFVLTGCGGVSEDDIKESIDNKKAGETAKLIKSYAKQDDKKELDKAVAKDFKELCKSTEYSDFVYMDNVIAKLKDEELKATLTEVVQKNGSNKVLAFIETDWVRRDYTNLDGVVITVKNNKNDSVAILSDTKKCKDKDFKIGDVKWKNIKPMSSNEFVFEDLCKGDDDSYYEQGYATIDYDKNQINCKISTAKKSYKKGNTQVWIKKDVIDEKKEILSKKDFVVSGKKVEMEPGGGHYWYDNKYVRNKKLKKKLNKITDKKDFKIRDNITIGKSDRNEVIKSYGYGSILYRSYKQNMLYDAIKDSNEDKDKGIIDIMKQAEYSVVYFDKKHKRYFEMVFDSNDKMMGAIAAYLQYK